MATLPDVVRAVARPRSRSPLRPHYKPSALLVVLQLLDEGGIRGGAFDVDVVVARLRQVFSDFDPEHEARVYQPLWHLRNDGAWTLTDAAQQPLSGPEWRNWDERPKSLASFARVARIIHLDADDQFDWNDASARADARRSLVSLLRGEALPVCHAIAAAFDEGPAQGFQDAADEDYRKLVWAEIVRRRGQAKFRRDLLTAYGGQCAITGSTAIPVLEAAHVRPYRGDHTNSLDNGLLLRADVHTLFDLHLVSVDPSALSAWIAPALRGSEYLEYHGRPIWLPEVALRPNVAAIAKHHRTALAQNDGES